MTLDGLLRPAADSLHPVPDLDYDLQRLGDAVEESGDLAEVNLRARHGEVVDVAGEVADLPEARDAVVDFLRRRPFAWRVPTLRV